jgi:thiol-disulfide isomerase/thioredoxin
MVGRKVTWKYPIAAAVVTVFIFGGIFAAGLSLSDYKVSALNSSVETVQVEQNSRLVGQDLSTSLEQNSCKAMGEWMNTTVDDLRELRKEVASYEEANKIENDRYELVKKEYMNLMLQNLAHVREYDRNCDRRMVDIVYFYSDDCDACKDQGTILTHVGQEYGQKVVVFPLDTELGMSSISFLLDYYEIDEYPSLVIDGEIHEGYSSTQELQSLLDRKLNTTSNTTETSR